MLLLRLLLLLEAQKVSRVHDADDKARRRVQADADAPDVALRSHARHGTDRRHEVLNLGMITIIMGLDSFLYSTMAQWVERSPLRRDIRVQFLAGSVA